MIAQAHPGVLLGPHRPELIRDEVLADILEATAAEKPDQVALIYGDRQLTYKELNTRADRIASELIEAGVRAGQIVGLWLPRGMDLLVMQAAIAKTGAAWLPFDADTPIERIALCLTDAGAAGIVSCDEFAPLLGRLDQTVWTAGTLALEAELPHEALRRRERVQPGDPAYVIYTSGSTGKPKGIAISQGSICHFLRSENDVLGIRSSDRVYQGFSVAFDMSFEEIWISYLAGATLWIAPKDLAVDPDALPRALAENGITVLHAVPTLLALFTHDVPGLRIINLGGEPCPESLVIEWARDGRRIFNTYGPTETTVSASLAELHPGEPVTIGYPLPNYGMLVVDPENKNELAILPRGEVGELCITGPGVGAGYLGQPKLTSEKFHANPWADDKDAGRLYRTGDLARIDSDGRVHCLGRTDDQVKIRGFRVELGEIEAALSKQPGVGTATVMLYQVDDLDRLVAFVTPKDGSPSSAGVLRDALRESLPPYMVPDHFEVVPEMPRLASGKIDRRALRARHLAPSPDGAADSDSPETPAEEALFAALRKLFPGQSIRRGADFFSDLGGHSLLAARLASALRTDPRFAHVTVSDIYKNRTAGRIAEVLAQAPEPASDAGVNWVAPSARKRWLCGAAQAAAIPVLMAVRMAQWLAPFFIYQIFTGDPGDSIPYAIVLSIGAFLLMTTLEFAVTIAGYRLIAGGLRPGRYPLWGLTFYRWWLADRLVETAPAYLLSGSPMYAWWLRALGARIGNDVVIGGITLRAPSLLTVRDGASVGNAVNFENARVEHGELRLGTIVLDRNSCVGSAAVLEGNTSVGEFGHLEGQSELSDGNDVPPGRIWCGSPARDIGAFDLNTNPPRPKVSGLQLAGESLFFSLGGLLITALFFMPVFASFVLIDWLDNTDKFPWLDGSAIWFQLGKYFVLALPAAALLVIGTALLSGLIRWSMLPRLKAGRWPVHSTVYLAKWLVNQIQETSLNVLHGVYATVYAPFWYRLLGAQVGHSAEISTALGVVPHMLTMGDDTFVGDGVMLGDEQIDGGWMTMKPTVISRRAFVGNGAYIPDGTSVPENVLIGVHTRAPENDLMREGDTWLGSPPLSLPAREQVSGFPEGLTYRPTIWRRISRGFVEAFRIIIPFALATAVGYTVLLNVLPAAEGDRWGQVSWELTVAGVLYGVGTFAFVAVLKWLLIFRYKTCSRPMWTYFVWISEAVTNLYEGIAVPNFMRYLLGTPWLPIAFNLLGCKIGRGVYMDTTDITEFDCVKIGDYSELNAVTCPQTHLFEDRVMKIGHVVIGKRVYMGPRSTVLYDATVGDAAKLGALTLVMKGEYIPAQSSWRGCPAAPAHDAPPRPV
ncbi:MAG TPA: Pls/PosA family non-ribosomal peptide synthetase [Candidatus Rubrimentiphilum sp.]|nr:Pls/PosA family non-ribosomal peptide synthetase [Candidatus Rubrimentiphilum sp.]